MYMVVCSDDHRVAALIVYSDTCATQFHFPFHVVNHIRSKGTFYFSCQYVVLVIAIPVTRQI